MIDPERHFDVLIAAWLRVKEAGCLQIANQLFLTAVKYGQIHGFM